ncbi:MAG: hypothetical protein GX414_03735 [Acidobacteria bacterium]|nr:hypothetical protein [Acidobacteriota bacterium]
MATACCGLYWLLVVSAAGSAPAPVEPGPPPDAVVISARKLMPPALRDIMERRQHVLLAAFRSTAPAADLPGARAELVNELTAMDRRLAGTPLFDEVVAGFGAIARRVCDHNTMGKFAESAEEHAYFTDFHNFVDCKHHRFVAVFNDYSPLLFVDDRSDLYLEAMAQRNRNYAHRIAALYREGGSSRTFDDRSPAFGLASLHFSHTITDIANLWLYCWRRANGDLTGTPFYSYSKKVPQGERSSP